MPTIADQKRELRREIIEITLETFRGLTPEKQEKMVSGLIWSATYDVTLAQLKKWRRHVEHTWVP